ncbi:acyltransferase family protein [Phaeodactylibacter luteus]|uniref:Acyltransferase n=1 Tax=Phaeodactylibacter luteus TaxID=1564516 RepID=A0A5C6RPD8_9BACT|nr:acyltransferase [Phaeodactylibacter luteus]TXB63805.1 acyltransferase [Phaeodactylibacter luteus]
MKLTYYKNLDGVRAIAALMVMVFHFFQGIEPSTKVLSYMAKAAIFGQTGVTLFFVLSGFLITRILMATKETKGYFKNFYARRTLRIFPLYYLFLLLYYFVAPLILQTKGTDFSQQIYYYTYLQNFAITFDWNAVGPTHFWSLAVEEHFYLFWPLVVFFVSKKNLWKIIAGIVIMAFLLRLFMLDLGYGVFYFTFTRFDALAIGALLALIEERYGFRETHAKKYTVLAVGLFLPTTIMWTIFSGSGNDTIQVIKFLFLATIYFSFIGLLLSLKSDHITNKVLKGKFFAYTGKISYGLYVYHPLAYSICDRFFRFEHLGIDFLTKVALAYSISAISFHFFESKFLKMKKYFNYQKQRDSTQLAYQK